ncbi:F-box domain protein [Aspergillus fischeri NRRL 181]|uniref:F-box domain protein n=1 Tax=Neosartorya fischeri (strain ATCC 1020 / DSM 3700 / CBS 544.65 / FGSC A1164 / JCM 1740 / NRRL 181 / WB 181) TaxID=331117 RepID=A1D8M8_NEOFI|nr:F-box domain protein [Aspergillus fischeri NRRL 181]EAW20739.1 F-box domain protein [Aspergillus fischeri NRRL 181]
MGKITFYCNICGGPLSYYDLRKASTAWEGEDLSLCYEDDCDCEAGTRPEAEGDEDGEDDENSTAACEHDSYCASLRGYSGHLISEKDILWLEKVRMLRPRDSRSDKHDEMQDDDDAYYITEIGSYDPCSRPLEPRRVYLAMQARLGDDMETSIDWEDSRVYGGTEDFQSQEWEAEPGYEWLVADPLKPVDIAELVSASKSSNRGSTNAIVNRGALELSGVDPFSSLPWDIRYRILQMLPSPSVINLVIASTAFRGATRDLPDHFWRLRLGYDCPWIDQDSIRQNIAQTGGQVNYKDLIRLVKEAAAKPEDGINEDQDSWLNLRNRHRIWTCCEVILGKLEAKSWVPFQSKCESGEI